MSEMDPTPTLGCSENCEDETLETTDSRNENLTNISFTNEVENRTINHGLDEHHEHPPNDDTSNATHQYQNRGMIPWDEIVPFVIEGETSEAASSRQVTTGGLETSRSKGQGLPPDLLEQLLRYPSVRQSIVAYPTHARPAALARATKSNAVARRAAAAAAAEDDTDNVSQLQILIETEKKPSRTRIADPDTASETMSMILLKPIDPTKTPSFLKMQRSRLNSTSPHQQQVGSILTSIRDQRDEAESKKKSKWKPIKKCCSLIHDFITTDSIVCITFIALLTIIICSCIAGIVYPVIKAEQNN